MFETFPVALPLTNYILSDDIEGHKKEAYIRLIGFMEHYKQAKHYSSRTARA